MRMLEKGRGIDLEEILVSPCSTSKLMIRHREASELSRCLFVCWLCLNQTMHSNRSYVAFYMDNAMIELT
jgi:hypothetical protein